MRIKPDIRLNSPTENNLVLMNKWGFYTDRKDLTMGFKNFKLASYLRAYDINEMTDEELGMKIDEFKSKIHIDKVYIENHRGSITIPVERLKSVKAIVESRNLIAAGGITCTSLVNNVRKPAIFDTYCYTDPDRNGGGWIDPYPEFPNDTTTVLFTESTAEREDSMEVLEKFVRDGGNAIVTMGYFKKMYDKGIKDLTSVRLTGRHVIGSRYMIQNANSWNNKIINSFLSSSTQRKLWNKVYDALK